MYRIEYDADAAILNVVLVGFWTAEKTQRFAGEVAAELGALRRQGLRFGVLADAREFAVQARDVIDGLMRVINASDQKDRAPTAIIVGTALGKMQAELRHHLGGILAKLDTPDQDAWVRIYRAMEEYCRELPRS